jgi:short-subunit dehydrogenase
MAYACALVTGATSGIGKSLAMQLPAETNLVLTGRAEERLADLKRSMAQDGRRVETVVADLATDEGRERVIAAAEAANIDLLINNAGLGRFGAFAENPPEMEREMVEVNVVAPVVLTRALLPSMLAKSGESGRRAGIIIVSSVAGFQPLAYFGTYAATKSFDLLFAEALAAELKDQNVDVLALCPGATRTDFFNRAGLRGSVMPYLVDPDDVARRTLNALGKRTIVVTDPVQRVVRAPALVLRALKNAMTAKLMRNLGDRHG